MDWVYPDRGYWSHCYFVLGEFDIQKEEIRKSSYLNSFHLINEKSGRINTSPSLGFPSLLLSLIQDLKVLVIFPKLSLIS